MKRFIATFAACALLYGAAFSLAEPVTARAEEEKDATRLTTENTELFLPASYEQYLPLIKPSHVAVNDRYTVVADGALLYVHDKEQNAYSVYEHRTGETQEATVVSELQFTEDGRLYFTDERTMLYAYDFSAHTAASTGIPCATFLIAGEYLYFATATVTNQVSFYYVSLSKIDYDAANPIKRDGEFYGKNPHLAYENGVLHCMFNNARLVCDASSKTFTGEEKPLDKSASPFEQINGLHYVCAYNGALYYTVKDAGASDGLYRTDDDGNAVRLLEAKGLSTLAVSNGRLYCVKDSSVLEIAVSESSARFTGYEITSASSSYNRLNGAVDSVRAGDLLVTADAGNDRISIYNFKTEKYSVVPCPNVTLVATDGDTIAATDGSTITVFSYDNLDAQNRYEISEGMGEVKGVICLFSEIYYVTAHGAYGKIGEENPIYYSSYGYPTGMTCDLYGTIYVSYLSGTVSSFREEDFTERGNGVELDIRLPANHTSLRADFKGNLYCLADGMLYQNGKPFAEKAQNAAFVYGDESEASSFALGFEDSAVYLSYGNYLVRTKQGTLDVPTLSAIPLENAKENIFTPHDENDLLVQIGNKSVGILIDIGTLESSEAYFPYAGYSRKAATTGVLLTTVGEYSLVAIEENGLSAMLFRTENCTPLDKETYYAQEDKNAYLTNSVTVCYFPCMEEALANAKLSRGERVRVTGIITAPDREYALVVFGETENRGYLPLSYLTDVSPLTTDAQAYKLGYLKASAGAVLFSDGGERFEVKERRLVRVYENEDGTYTVATEENGVTYSAKIEKSALENGKNDALRYSLIIGLSVVAVLIIGVYVYLVPVRKR